MAAHLHNNGQEAKSTRDELRSALLRLAPITHNIISGLRTNGREHLPDRANKVAELREDVRVLLGVELRNLTDRGTDLLQRSWSLIIVVLCR